MAISKIEIKNFTVFEDIAIELCGGADGGVNVFIGDNGTGKTHLLKVLYAFCGHEVEIGRNGARQLENNFYLRLRECFQGVRISDLIRRNTPSPAEAPFAFELQEERYIFNLWHLEASHFHKLDNMSKSENPPKAEIAAAFIPAKDMLTHSELVPEFALKDLPFDKTLRDILYKAGATKDLNVSNNMRAVQEKIVATIRGKILYERSKYSIDRDAIGQIEFAAEAEGHKKIALIHRLIETGYIKKGSVLLWDEPEANINPKLIPDLVEIILELSRCGVQVFIATHDYFLPKYVEVLAKESDSVAFHSLHKPEEGGGVKCESRERFSDLDNNSIVEEIVRLYEREIEKVME